MAEFQYWKRHLGNAVCLVELFFVSCREMAATHIYIF